MIVNRKWECPAGSVRLLIALESPKGLIECLCNRHFFAARHRTAVWRGGFFARTEPSSAARRRSDGSDLCTFFGRNVQPLPLTSNRWTAYGRTSKTSKVSGSLRYSPAA